MSRSNINLNADERKAFRLHVSYSLIEGVILGVLALNEFVFIKSLKGTDFQIGLLFQASMVVFVFLIFLNEFIRRIKNKSRLLRWLGIITRAPLAIMAFFPQQAQAYESGIFFHFVFLGIFLLYYFASPIIYPSINQLLKGNYRHDNFGKLYSYATSLNKIVMLVVTFVYAWMLDQYPYAFTWAFPVIAVLGISSVYLLSLIPYKTDTPVVIKRTFGRAVKDSVKRMVSIIKDNKPYMHFEIGFMLYGLAFMITIAVITIFFDKELKLNYSSVAFYKNSYNILAIIWLPFFGKLLGKIDPRRFAALTFGSVAFYLFFMMLTQHYNGHMYIWDIKLYWMMIPYILGHSVFAATMSLLWSIGSAYFCKPEEAGDYQSVHLSLTGIRALFAPLFGVFFFEMMGFTWTFSLAIFLLLVGVVVMFWSYRREKKGIKEAAPSDFSK